MKEVLKSSPVFVFFYFEDVNQATRLIVQAAVSFCLSQFKCNRVSLGGHCFLRVSTNHQCGSLIIFLVINNVIKALII